MESTLDYKNNFYFLVLNFSKSSTDSPFKNSKYLNSSYKVGPYKMILRVCMEITHLKVIFFMKMGLVNSIQAKQN